MLGRRLCVNLARRAEQTTCSLKSKRTKTTSVLNSGGEKLKGKEILSQCKQKTAGGRGHLSGQSDRQHTTHTGPNPTTPPTPGRSGHGKGSRREGEALGQEEGAKVIPYAPKGRDGDKHQNNS